MQRKYWLCLWLTAVLLLFFANGSLLVTDSVEANYALTAKEMVQSGDWLSPQIYGRYWYDKPIMFYWLTAMVFKFFGFTEFAARFFPAIFGLAGLGLVCYAGRRLYNERVGFYSGVMLLSSVEFFLISKSIITDAVLFFFFSGTLLFFYLGYSGGSSRDWYLMYLCAALAVLTKGPVGVLLPGLIITLFLLWRRDWQVLLRCRLLSGLLLFLAAALPWYVIMYSLHGSAFIETFFGTHNFLRATVSEHPRDNVIYYYCLVNILALFPWSGLLPGIIYRKYRESGCRLAVREGFLLLWAGIVFIFFQCMATKYLTYTYPLLFPAVLLLAHAVDKYGDKCFSLGCKIFTGVFIGLLLAAAWWAKSGGLLSAERLFWLPLCLIGGMIIYYLFEWRTGNFLYGLSALCIAFYFALIYSVAIPFAQQRSAKVLGNLLAQWKVETAGVYGKYPTSAVFYSDTKLLKLLDAEQVAGYVPKGYSWSSKNVMPYVVLGQESCSFVVVHKKCLERYLKQKPKQILAADEAGEWLLFQ